MTCLRIHDICLRYGNREVVGNVSLEVGRGEVVGLLGPNGSGKSTTLAAAAGAIEPCRGSISIAGIERGRDPIGYALNVGLVPQEPGLFEEMTAWGNLCYFGRLFGLGGKELRRRVATALDRVGIGSQAGGRVGTLSGGFKQRVNLAAALIHDPPVLLLDEPTASLDADSRDRWLADVSRLREEGHAVLFSTHHWEEAEAACDRVAVLEKGRVAAYGPPRNLVRRPTTRATLYGHLRTRPPSFLVQGFRDRLGPGIELEITGRRLRLSAPTSIELGRTLARLLAEGWEIETFRTPSASPEYSPGLPAPMDAEAA